MTCSLRRGAPPQRCLRHDFRRDAGLLGAVLEKGFEPALLQVHLIAAFSSF